MEDGVQVVIPADLSEVYRHVESTSPKEGCGVIFKSAAGAFRVVPMQNVYDKYAARDPARFPRSSHTAYKMNELELARLLEAAENTGETLSCIFHSHVDVGAYFSKEDKEMAAPPPDHQPVWPSVGWLVVAVDKGKATGHKLFVFKSGDFVEVADD
jgi:[CysO sulfur-carrier protein]-S-L-cysteine hydrolase